MQLVGEQEGEPYGGILTFMIIPGVFLPGLLLIPVGLFRERSRRRAAIAAGRAEGPPDAILDFNRRPTSAASAAMAASTRPRTARPSPWTARPATLSWPSAKRIPGSWRRSSTEGLAPPIMMSDHPAIRSNQGGEMAKARRTTHRSTAGKKLYAVRDKHGRFKDIQTYERAHRADLARKSKAELEADAKKKARKKKAAKKATRKTTRKR
jgi:hypothetical protein